LGQKPTLRLKDRSKRRRGFPMVTVGVVVTSTAIIASPCR
jgi:hypothetical protein